MCVLVCVGTVLLHSLLEDLRCHVDVSYRIVPVRMRALIPSTMSAVIGSPLVHE